MAPTPTPRTQILAGTQQPQAPQPAPRNSRRRSSSLDKIAQSADRIAAGAGRVLCAGRSCSRGGEDDSPQANDSALPHRPIRSALDIEPHCLVSLRVPDGCEPGAFVNFVGHDGLPHSAIVPAGLAADQPFQVELLHSVVLQSQLVQVPEGATAGSSVAFCGPCGQPRVARVPDGLGPQDAFPVQVPVPQPVPVGVSEASSPGDEVMFVPPDGRPRMAVVPQGVTAGQTFMALVEPMPVAPIEPLADIDLQPWLEAAQNFKMNVDFEVPSAENLDTLDFPGLMTAMKAESAGKLTIQALSDKIVLSRMLDNMGVQQMPLLLAIQNQEMIPQEVQRFVGDWVSGDARDVIMKPTHLSNGEGVKPIPVISEEEKDATVELLETHLRTFMDKKAKEYESQALQSLTPGFVIQPKYKSCVEFDTPLEIRVVTLWGKARMGVWWWGVPYTGTPAQRNTWVVRRPLERGQLNDDDHWEVAHEHQGHNVGFEKALRLFVKHMPQMARSAERVASAVGAPFLRVDFFVGDSKWGVRLNEVAYGSGTLHRRPSDKGGLLLVDDAHAMAQILRQGMAKCQTKLPADQFLAPLGVSGDTYESLSVQELPAEKRFKCLLRDPVLKAAGNSDSDELEHIPAELCTTPRSHWMPQGFTTCVGAPQPSCQGRAGRAGDEVPSPHPDNRTARGPSAAPMRPPGDMLSELRLGESRKKLEFEEESNTWKAMFGRFVSSAPSWPRSLSIPGFAKAEDGIQEAAQTSSPMHRMMKPFGGREPQMEHPAWRGA